MVFVDEIRRDSEERASRGRLEVQEVGLLVLNGDIEWEVLLLRHRR